MSTRAPSDFVRRMAPSLPRGDVLEVACGAGRNLGIFLARGDRVFGIDRDRDRLLEARAAAPAGAPLFLAQADLEEMPLPASRFDVILNVRYLQRSLAPALRAALRPGGVIVFETFLVDQAQLGHPRNPDYLLAHGELVALFPGLEVLHYDEGLVRDGDRDAHLARLVARRSH